MIEKTGTKTARAVVREVFSSVQGEGVRIGRRQIFCRLEGCNLSCDYCDTPPIPSARKACRIELEPGGDRWETDPNPLTAERALHWIRTLDAEYGPHDSVSFTGGEPLLYGPFLTRLFPRVKEAGLSTYLETNGNFPDVMKDLAPWIDFVSLDFKLPFGEEGFPEPPLYRDFVTEIPEDVERQVKIVVKAGLSDEAFDAGLDLHAELTAPAPLVLQPVTPFGPVTEADVPSPHRILELARRSRSRFEDVRVIPQMHKSCSVR